MFVKNTPSVSLFADFLGLYIVCSEFLAKANQEVTKRKV